MIYEHLHRGEENAIQTKDLVAPAGLGNARELRSVIAREREAGKLILSTVRGGGGYFLPDEGEKGAAEIDAYIATLRSRALNTLKILKPASEAAKAYMLSNEQITLFSE